MNSQNRVPLFINRFSLSPRTSVGVQTLRLIGPHQDWLHFHWWSNSLKQLDERSVLFENSVLSRYAFLHNPMVLRLCERLRISSWSGSDLRPALAQSLTDQYRGRVSSAYVAPLGEADATRCLELVNLVAAPFVLHLWDVLDGDVTMGAPVSYTHLDVYKRQALLRPLLAESVAGTRSEELGEGIVSLVLALTLRLCILLVGVGRHSDVDHRRCDLRGNRFDSLVKRKERRNAVVA